MKCFGGAVDLRVGILAPCSVEGRRAMGLCLRVLERGTSLKRVKRVRRGGGKGDVDAWIGMSRSPAMTLSRTR
jgi:hypothetical protein